MQFGFYFDQTRCINCYACDIACKTWQDIPAGQVKLREMITIEEGEFPDLQVNYLPSLCYHCKEPACAEVCPVDAIEKRSEDGLVIVNQEDCIGKSCGRCLEACPYEAPQFYSEKNSKMEKCDFCLDRLEKNMKPACVEACPVEALDAGDIKELESNYEGRNSAIGFTHINELGPSIIFKKGEFNK